MPPSPSHVRLAHLVVVNPDTDADLMRRVAVEMTWSAPKGLPSPMVTGLHDATASALRGSVPDYWFMVLISCQARPGGETSETLALRNELESIFMTELFGPPPVTTRRAA